MHRPGSIATALLLLAACESRQEQAPGTNDAASANVAAANGAAPAENAAAPAAAATGWDLQSSGEGVALALPAGPDRTAIRLFCAAGRSDLLVNVPGFRPIGSEERLSFGSGGDAVALVADTRGDRARGGVSGAGDVPANLAALLARPLSASYGAQRSGPHPVVPQDLARSFAAACAGRVAAAAPPATPAKTGAAGPCMMQGTERLQVAPLRAVGTEPFWGARIEGRCVTYSHPEDQSGTRVWTRYAAGSGGGGTWTGALGGRPFRMTIRAQAGCSDGMSDDLYPFAVDLLVGGERRTGCARPA